MRLTFFILFAATLFGFQLSAQESPSIQLPQIQSDIASGKEAPEEETSEESVRSIRIRAAQLQLLVNVELAARDAGVIESVEVTEGDTVGSGQVIARMDRDTALANSGIAKSELDIAKAESENDIDLRYARVSRDVSGKVYQRSINAFNQFSKSVSKTELERLRLEYERARLSGEQAQRTACINEMTVELKRSQMDLADVQLKNREIKAPASGTIVEVYRQPGEWVQPGQPIARIIDLKKLRVSCRCRLDDASPDSLAREATFVCQDREYKATVVFASPEIDPDVQDFIVWAEVENPDGRLKPGMRGSMELQARDP